MFLKATSAVVTAPCAAKAALRSRVPSAAVSSDLRVLHEGLSKEITPLPKDKTLVRPNFEFKDFPMLIDLCMTAIGIAENSRGNDDVKNEFFALQSEFGDINIPRWLNTPEGYREYVSSYVMSAKGEYPFNGDRDWTLYLFFLKLEEKITRRSGYKFEGYKGDMSFGL